MAAVITEKDISTEIGEKDSIGVGQYTNLKTTIIERNIYWSRESSPNSEQRGITQNDLSTSLPIGFPIPTWDNCEVQRFEYFCDIYFAVIATLILTTLKITLLIPFVSDMSLYDHLSRIYPGTDSWPAVIVNGIIITIGYIYIVTLWLNQIKVIFLYPLIDRFVVWINIGILAPIAFLPIGAALYNVCLDSIVIGFFCFFTSLAGIFQCVHIIYVYVCNYYDNLRDFAHENSNLIVLVIQMYAALDIPIRLLIGYGIWFIPKIGNSSLFIVYIGALFAPFDSILLEKIFIYTQKKRKDVGRIVVYLENFKHKLSVERFAHFTDGIFGILVTILLVDMLIVFTTQILFVIDITPNATSTLIVPTLLKSYEIYFYSLSWGLCVNCSFWIVSYHMFYRIKAINRMILFIKFFGLFLANFLPTCVFLLGEYGKKVDYANLHTAVVLSLSVVTAIGIVQLVGWSYLKVFEKSLSIEKTRVTQDIRIALIIIILPSISFILLIIELSAVNSITVFKLFLIYLVNIPITGLIETFPTLLRFIGKCYADHGDKVTGIVYYIKR